MLLACPGSDWEEKAAWISALFVKRAGVCDFLNAFARWVDAMRPDVEIDLKKNPSFVMRLVAAYGRIDRLTAASDAWHAHPLLQSRPGLVAPDTTWPVPFAPVDLGGGWRAICLPGASDLVDEGRRDMDANGIEGLSHCVANYAEPCAMGASLIVSLRRGPANAPPARISTIELAPSAKGGWNLDGKPYALIQHRARSNAEPDREAKAVALDLSRRLSEGRIPIDAAALARRPAPERIKPIEALALFHHWRRLLPPALAGLGCDAMLDLLLTDHDAPAVPDPAAVRKRPGLAVEAANHGPAARLPGAEATP